MAEIAVKQRSVRADVFDFPNGRGFHLTSKLSTQPELARSALPCAGSVPVALEVSRSGVGSHAWVFFTSPVPAETARRLGTGLLREAMALRGRMTLASYDRLFPSQDLLPVGGIGNLIAAPLFKPARDNGTTVFPGPGEP
jgi:hypothetical protein